MWHESRRPNRLCRTSTCCCRLSEPTGEHETAPAPEGVAECRLVGHRVALSHHRVTMAAGERQPIRQSLAHQDAPGAHQLADDNDRVGEVAVRPRTEASTLRIIGIAVKRRKQEV